MRRFKVTLNGKSYEVSVEELTETREEHTESAVSAKEEGLPEHPPEQATDGKVKTPKQPGKIAAGDRPVTAPLGGTIMTVKVKTGEKVPKGRVLLSMEALKMENEIVAPAGGTVGEIYVEPGATVENGDILLTLRSG